MVWDGAGGERRRRGQLTAEAKGQSEISGFEAGCLGHYEGIREDRTYFIS